MSFEVLAFFADLFSAFWPEEGKMQKKELHRKMQEMDAVDKEKALKQETES